MQLLERNLHRIPDETYRDVFPKKPTTKIQLQAGQYHTATRQAAVMTDKESVKVGLHFEKKILTLMAHGSEAGWSKVEMPIEYEGKPLDIAFNPQFITEMLRVLPPDESLTMEITDGNTPALFRSGDNYSYIVMPLS
jgi:DNA polymerase-3 subunit beta